MTVCGIEHADGVCVMGECPYIKKCCPAVWDKSKPQEMTNEEWFTSLSTEEKARFFDRICYSAWGDINSRFRDMADYTDWVEWLKQPHTNE